MNPTVSVLMSVHNGESYLASSIASVLQQTMPDFELIVLNDGSMDRSGNILQRFSGMDSRLSIVDRENNEGLAAALNAGLKRARGTMIARMDADDIMAPDRLRQQVRFLDHHPDVGIVGSDVFQIDENGCLTGYVSMPRADWEIRWTEASALHTGLIHPSVMFRRSTLEAAGLAYDPAYRAAQDKKLWAALLRVTRAANIPKPLLYYRRHGRSISGEKNREQRSFAEMTLRLETERRLQRALTEEDWRLFTDGTQAPELAQFRRVLCKAMAPEWGSQKDSAKAYREAGFGIRGRIIRRLRALKGRAYWRTQSLRPPAWLPSILAQDEMNRR